MVNPKSETPQRSASLGIDGDDKRRGVPDGSEFSEEFEKLLGSNVVAVVDERLDG
jgi:hypothetical protein